MKKVPLKDHKFDLVQISICLTQNPLLLLHCISFSIKLLQGLKATPICGGNISHYSKVNSLQTVLLHIILKMFYGARIPYGYLGLILPFSSQLKEVLCLCPSTIPETAALLLYEFYRGQKRPKL